MALLPLASLLVLSLSLLLGPAAAAPKKTTSEVIWEMQQKINSSKNYGEFQKYFYSSTAPIAIFDLIESGTVVTLFVPSNRALAKIPESLKSVNTTFGAIVLFNSIKGKMSIGDFHSADIGATWKSLYANADFTKVEADTKTQVGLTISGSTNSSAVIDLRKGNFYTSSNLLAHGVTSYLVPAGIGGDSAD